MPHSIGRVAVLGAGTMGSQIAALLASFGYPCDLLDIAADESQTGESPGNSRARSSESRSAPAIQAMERLKKLQPAPLMTGGAAGLIRPGNFEDDMPRLAEADWVIEAVVENLDIKHELWEKAVPHLKDGAIISTNTSGIPIKHIARVLPEHWRTRFLGTHFFNPPRYLHLLEIIPTDDTDPEVVEAVKAFGTRELGKGAVMAKDTPNFIGNRIGTYGLMVSLYAMLEHGLGPDEVDSLTGPVMGRPRSATFRTLDLVGLDVMAHVAGNIAEATDDPHEKEIFSLPPLLAEMLRRGWLGEKTGQGFYRRERRDGERVIMALDPETMEYRPRRRLRAPSLEMAANIDHPGDRVRRIIAADDAAGKFAWHVLKRTLLYTAEKAEEIAPDIVSIDRAMKWGFGWEMGPFEMWDALGLARTVERMEAEGETIPDWVRRAAESEGAFYTDGGDGSLRRASFSGPPAAVETDPRVLSVDYLERKGNVIRKTAGATLYDLGEDVAFLDFHAPNQALGPDLAGMANYALEQVQKNYRGLVLGSHVRPNFSVGANLFLVLLAAQEGDWFEIDMMARQFQQMNQRFRFFEKPIVMAPYGMTLGGGAEVAFAGDTMVAAAETYIGLVEVGAGVVPAGGGCKEMLRRTLSGVPGAVAADAPGAGGGAAGPRAGGDPGAIGGGGVDIQPLVNSIFETIGTAKVATSAYEAKEIGYLRDGDRVVANLEHQLYEARREVLALDGRGYKPPAPSLIRAVGRDGRAVLELGAHNLHWAGYASDYDLHIAKKLAHVLAGGDVPAGTMVTEQYLLDLEREAFLSLVGEPKTQARMQHILKTGRPLRN